ncbi:MAG: DsbA family protein [Anaerolineales bacterium]|nr:DsbA family protein [Anaerolineales bacterium]
MGKRQEIRERRKKIKRRQRLIMVLLVSGVALIFVALLIGPTIGQALTPVGDYVIKEFYQHPLVSGNTMGDPNAPVVIEEYSDFGCGHCASFAETTSKQLSEEFIKTGKVRFIFHSVGGLIGSQTTPIAAEAAYCAEDQNKFWEYHDAIYANQYQLFFADPRTDIMKFFNSFAKDLGLDTDAFQSCLEGGKYRDKVNQDEADARKAGVDGTPTFFVNGEIIRGAQPYEVFKQMIATELNQ